MTTGTIAKKVQDKGFGFIKTEDGKDFFFHTTSCDGQFESLEIGATVQFNIEDSPKGQRAVNVKAAA